MYHGCPFEIGLMKRTVRARAGASTEGCVLYAHMNMSSDELTFAPSTTAEQCRTECIRPADVIPLIGRVADAVSAQDVAEFFAIMGDTTRLQVLHALSQADELCVCDLSVLVDSSQSAVSHQLRTLRSAGFVERRREGRMVFYRLADEHVAHILRDGFTHRLGER